MESQSETKQEEEAASVETELSKHVEDLTITSKPKGKKGKQKVNKQLIRDLHSRSQLTERVHVGVVRWHKEEGFHLDAIIYDNSEQEPKLEPQSKQHEKRIPASSNSQSIDHPRYVIPAIIKWERFPRSILHTPLEERIAGSCQYFPSYSIVNIYCDAIDENRGVIYAKIANRSAPRFVLPNSIQKGLSYCVGLPPQVPPVYQGGRPRFLIIIDYEATCDFSPNPVVTMENSEIIEFPWVVLDTVTLEIVHEHRIYVKPDFIDGITNYCTRLTGITKEDCENGVPLAEAIQQFDGFISQFIFQYGPTNFRIVTDSVWDLQVQLRQEAARKQIFLSWWYTSYFDLREEFRHFYAWIPFLRRDPPLYIMLNAFDLSFVGRHHSGLDDCKTIAQVVKVLLQLYPGTFTNPRTIRHDYDPNRDNSWISFMSDCPPDSWLCTNADCAVYNKPSYKTCRFCKTPKPEPQLN